MPTFKRLVLLFAAMYCSHLAKADNGGNGQNKKPEGTLHGYVMDAVTRKPVIGVTVSVSSQKIPGEKEMPSDATGHFHFAKLPAGVVTLMFEKKGYKIFKRDVLAVNEGLTTKVSVEVYPIEDEGGGNEIWNPIFKLLN
ncbi:MAG: carboxypeptidase-like regulatory domain-containing protein [Chitinophagaceae bacterium]